VTEELSLTVNGRDVVVDVDPDTPLLTVLRNELGLFGSKFGCGLGLCGACFVRLEDAVVPSCDTPVWSAAAKRVVTVEGLSEAGGMHPAQQALLEHQAAQCGFCIPGIVVNAATLLEQNPDATEQEIVAALDRNLCRCGSHSRIVRALVQASGDQQ
jgi:nicotinate dehydrogenase subunit A